MCLDAAHHIKSLLGAQRSLAADPAGPFNCLFGAKAALPVEARGRRDDPSACRGSEARVGFLDASLLPQP
jgi:hypothetical protein